MKYSHYGLDEEKRSKDPGTKPKEWWCQWCDKHVTEGLYLCFSNWCICAECLEMSSVKYVHERIAPPVIRERRWQDDVDCFRCDLKGILGYENHHSCSIKYYLCKSCTDLGNHLINKIDNTSTMTQQKETKVMGELLQVPLAKITPSSTNPRKTFDEDAIKELSESIENKGVIQPVLLRPLGKDTYELVCGERRYRASTIVKDAKTVAGMIPAYIRDMSDDEALEMQITENLQRKDVHPIEEAVAFKSIIDNGHPAEEVANRIGKTVYFVNQRLKLNNLTDEWQKAFYYDKLSVTDALKVALLTVECQQDLYGEKFNVSDIKDASPIEITKFNLKKYSGDLLDTCFDITDAGLDKKVGACIGCQYNSATANLFENGQNTATCGNLKCYLNKSELAFNLTLQQVLDEPDAILVEQNWYRSDNLKKKFEPLGMEVYCRQEYDELEEPEAAMQFKEWEEDQNYDEDESEEDRKNEYDGYLKLVDAEWEEYRKDKESGQYKKALIVDGVNKGKFLYVMLNTHKAKKSSSTSADAASTEKAANGMTLFEINAEIDRINTLEKRKKELDAEKVHTRVKEELKKSAYWKTTEPLKASEYIAGIMLHKTKVRYDDRTWAKKLLGDHYDEYGGAKLFDYLSKKPIEQLQAIFFQMLRYVAYIELRSEKDNPQKSNNAAALRNVALDYISEDVKTFDLEQQEVAIKRIAKVNQKLDALKKQKKELEAAAKPKAEKPAAKGKGVKALLTDAPEKKAAPKKSAKKSK